MKFNRAVGREGFAGGGTLDKQDIVDVLRTLIAIRNGEGTVDDIDHLGNRRVRCVGEMTENIFRTGLARVERAVREKLSQSEIHESTPQDIINPRPVTASQGVFRFRPTVAIHGSKQPFVRSHAQATYLGAGPGGLTRARAGFEVRDVHPTHYGACVRLKRRRGRTSG